MTLYALFREGVYRHECGGIFKTPDAAKLAIESLTQQEPDHYHNWICVPFDLNKEVTTNNASDWYEFEINEPEPIEL